MNVRRITWWLLATVGLIVLTVVSWSNRYNIYDWYVLRSYTPPAEIAQLAQNSGMGDYGRRLFYVHSPEVSEPESFNGICTDAEQTIVLGCYTGTDIYIYNVTEPDLAGVKEVTAAHEMLHAAYERLSPSEKEHVDAMVESMYSQITSPRIQRLIESYQKKDPSVVTNELHSILATEVRSLSPELESYYARYFADRIKVVTYSENYEQVFNSAKNESERLLAQLTLRKSEIEKAETSLQSQSEELRVMRLQLDSYQETNDARAYNNLVPVFNDKVTNYNQDVASLKQLIAQYNELVIAYNNQIGRQQELVNSIDSKFEPTE